MKLRKPIILLLIAVLICFPVLSSSASDESSPAIPAEDTLTTYADALDIQITYPDQIKCGEPVTFQIHASGGSGNYQYRLHSLFNSKNEAIYDVSYGSNGNYSTNDTFTFTFYASGTYYIRFSVMDMKTFQTANTSLYEYPISINDPSYPSVDDIVTSVANECSKCCSTDFEKAVWLHDWIIDHADYDYSYSYCGTEGVLARGVGTCESYHRAYVLLLDAVGIRSGRITGNGHVWTAINIDGKWYQVDSTWDDGGSQYQDTYREHLYFGLTDELMGDVHSDHDQAVPGYESTSLDNNYFIKTGEIHTWSDPLIPDIEANLKAGTDHFTLPVSSNLPKSYRQILYSLAAYQLSIQRWEGGTLTVSYQDPSLICTFSKDKPVDPAPTDPSEPEVPDTAPVHVLYQTHVQTYGWQGWKQDGGMSGTSGQAKRLEAIEIKLNTNADLGIQYTTHCQDYGWLPWSANGESNGTTGQAKRLEAIKIQLTGSDKDHYDVYYRVHAQDHGWMGWAKNGAAAGTAGQAKRLEGIQIIIVPKGTAVNSSLNGIYPATSKPYISTGSDPVVAGADIPNTMYRVHVQDYSWQDWKYNGAASGTMGKAKRLEGIQLKLTNKIYNGSIEYRTHVQNYGWMEWKRDGAMSGTSGEAKRLEAIEIRLTGEAASKCDVYYRVHAQDYGWMGWTKNGASAGTAGQAKRLEAIEIRLVPKGGKAPGKTTGAFISK